MTQYSVVKTAAAAVSMGTSASQDQKVAEVRGPWEAAAGAEEMAPAAAAAADTGAPQEL